MPKGSLVDTKKNFGEEDIYSCIYVGGEENFFKILVYSISVQKDFIQLYTRNWS